MNELPEGFEYVGWYSPPEAKRFLDAMDEQGLELHAEIPNGPLEQTAMESMYGRAGAGSQVLIAVATSQRPMADSVHARLFGMGLGSFDEAAEWSDEVNEQEFELMKTREELVAKLSSLKDELKSLLDELGAVETEMMTTGAPEWRRSALKGAAARHRQDRDRMERELHAMEQELATIDQSLYGPTEQ